MPKNSDKDRLFKIRDKPTGLYSTGGTDPRFTTAGKTWRKGPLVSHLKLYAETWKFDQPALDQMKQWEIVPLEIVEQEPREVISAIPPELLVAQERQTWR